MRFAPTVEGKPKAAGRLTLFRAYKKGELPPIQVSLADVVRPLMALALRDGPIASC